MEQPPIKPEEEFVYYKGKKYRKVYSGYTVRQYFSHETPEKGPGPGWGRNTHMWEDDEEYSIKKYGRKISMEESFNPSSLPDEPYYYWEEVKEYAE